ncbi:MAG: hypothetical protein NT105_23325 [Verrucomicrobia bacterium]|nr:hypothetical protein [Verrucomicrobiota bacterium]
MKNAHILTTGDVVRDIATYQGDAVFPTQPGKIRPHFTDRLGGAKQLHEFIEAAVGKKQAVFGLDEMTPAEPNRTHPAVHTLWEPCAGGLKEEHEDVPKNQRPKDVWRVAKPLGYALLDSQHGEPPLKRSTAAQECPSVLVIDDASLGFRTVRATDRWPLGVLPGKTGEKDAKGEAIKFPQPDWIVLKMSNPIAQGDLWRELSCPAVALPSACGQRRNLVVITSADELRRAGAAVSRGYSWERTLTELCAELQHHPGFRPLLDRSRHLIVNFGCEGAVWFNNDCKPEDHAASPHPQHCAQLIYDPTLAEGRWKSLLANDARVYGHLNAFTAAIAVGLFDAAAKANTSPSLADAIKSGLSAARVLRIHGHGQSKNAPRLPLEELRLSLRDPQDAAQAKRVAPRGYETVNIPLTLDISDLPDWTLCALTENPDTPAALLNLPLYGLAHRVALYGLGALSRVPHGRFGKLVSIDRYEIETLRGLHQRIDAYVKTKQPKQPLCLAAFGPPGAGKSYGIKQIACEIFGTDKPEDVPILEFNLSQFDSPAMLIGAFHQVRDAVLKGRTPVVFWDEFDSRDYDWLRYFLAPMQDGTFQEAGHTHTLGKCIFVFAGGTSWDFEHFGPAPMPAGWLPTYAATTQQQPEADPSLPDDARQAIADLREVYRRDRDSIQVDQKANEEFLRRKGPDFLSRLDGHINVLGPNRRRLYDWSTRQWLKDDPSDITFPVRRAFLLRSFLGAKKDDDRIEMDRNLLRSLLHVPRYRHGARSLEKVVLPLTESTKPYRRAYLPPHQVLQQHLDSVADFDVIYRRNLEFLSSGNLRKIAAAIADFYDRKYAGGPVQTAEQALVTFAMKLPWERATNLAAAQRLPDILALVGLGLEQGKASSEQRAQVFAHIEHHLDTLAEEEHRLWMVFYLENGWQQVDDAKFADLEKLKVTDEKAYKAEIKRLKDEERRHTLLKPFKDLPDHEKIKDHDAIRNFPDMADLVGWRIAFVEH